MAIMATGCGCVSRRSFLSGAAALACAGEAAAQPAAFRIDVHHHLVPPDYLTVTSRHSPPLPPMKNWSARNSLDQMDRAGIRTSMLSITNPGLWFGDKSEAVSLARGCNEYAAGLGRDNPGRFGSFAALPMPDIDASLAEIAYALDVLKADGIAMFTNYGDKWLGDPTHAPVFEELNRRRAVVYTHPMSAACCVNVLRVLPDSAIEYGTDTTRAIATMVFGGFAQRYPDVQVIWSHAGGTMPFLVERFDVQARLPEVKAVLPDGVRPLLRRFHYDTAQVSNPIAMGALGKLVPVSQVLFGTDYPYRTCEEHVANLAQCGFAPAELRAIERDNAVAMLPGQA